MRRVHLTQPQSDCLEIEEGRDWRRVASAGVGALLWGSAFALMSSDGDGWFLVWVVGLLTVPVLGVVAARALRRRVRALVRTAGRLLLDGEPLELARVELRVTHRWLTKTPTGYALSLWVMGAAGPDDVDLGHFESMFDATRVSAQLDEFVAKANTKQPGRTHLS